MHQSFSLKGLQVFERFRTSAQVQHSVTNVVVSRTAPSWGVMRKHDTPRTSFANFQALRNSVWDCDNDGGLHRAAVNASAERGDTPADAPPEP